MVMSLPENLSYLKTGDRRDLLTVELFQCDFDVHARPSFGARLEVFADDVERRSQMLQDFHIGRGRHFNAPEILGFFAMHANSLSGISP